MNSEALLTVTTKYRIASPLTLCSLSVIFKGKRGYNGIARIGQFIEYLLSYTCKCGRDSFFCPFPSFVMSRDLSLLLSTFFSCAD